MLFLGVWVGIHDHSQGWETERVDLSFKAVFLHVCVRAFADEGLHQGVERTAFKQRGGTVECTEVSVQYNTSQLYMDKKLKCAEHAWPKSCFLSSRYTTRHLNDDSTSKQIRALLQWERERVTTKKETDCQRTIDGGWQTSETCLFTRAKCNLISN